jgi:L-fuculose-phosphate aldolase
MTEADLREEIVAHCLKMNASGINQGTSGNLSVRHRSGMLITPSAVAYDDLSPADVVWMDQDGSYEHSHEASTEWRFHRDIYAARPDVQAVVHAHPTYCTALAICGIEIPAVHYMIAAAGGPTVRCATYQTYGTQELSDAAIAALRGRNACLLANHGMIAVGPSLAKTLWLAVEIETLARQYTISRQVGTPRILSDDEIARVGEKFKNYGLKSRPAR